MSWLALFGFAKSNWKLLAIGVAVVVISIWRADLIKFGGAKVTSAVQSDTLKRLDAAGKDREKADEDVRKLPYDRRVDGLQ